MNHNIDLGTFSWDLSKIEKALIENRKQIEAFSGALAINKKALKDEQKEMQALSEEVVIMKAHQKSVSEQLKAGTLTQSEYNKTIAESNAVIAQNEARIREVAAAQSGHIKTILEQERAVKELRLESNELNKLLQAGRTEITDSEYAYRNLNKELNALKTEAKNLGAQLVELKRAGKENTDEYRQLEEQWKKVSTEADALNDEFKALDKAVGDNQRSVGDYKDQIVGAWGEIADKVKTGDLRGAFDSAKTGLSGLFDLIKTNPWILVLTGVAAFVKEMWEYNSQTLELNKTVEQIANTSGAATDELRKSAAALSETYGGEFTDRVREINSLMTDFGLTAQQAFDVYNNGLALGGTTNSEFADSIREYGPLFAQNGYSAQEFINILNAGIDLDIYSDKLPDAIKEAGLSLKEQTKATRDALVNAFGASFTDDILQRIQSGKTTVADGLNEIAAKSKEMHLNEQQLAQLTADVFKGAGEDAGGALKIFEAINMAQEENATGLTEIQKQTIELANKNYELEAAKEAAFKSDTVMAFGKDVENIWKDIQIFWYKSIDDITEFLQGSINGWRLAFMNTRDFIAMVPQAFRSVISGMKADFQNFGEIARTFGAVLKSAFTFDVVGVEANFNSLMAKVRAFQSQTKVEVGKVGSQLGKGGIINQKNTGIINARTETNKGIAQRDAARSNQPVTGAVADAQKKASGDAAKSASKAVSDAKKKADEQKKAAEKAAADALKFAQDLAQEKTDIAKNELAEYIATNAAKLESEKRLNAQSLAEKQKYYDELQARKQAQLDAEKAKELTAANLSAQDRANIDREYATKSLELANEIEKSKNELSKTWDEQQRADKELADSIAHQQRLIDIEEQGDNEYAVRSEQASYQRDEDLAKLEQQRAEDSISLENYEASKNLIRATYAEVEKQIEKDVNDYKLQSRSQVLSGLAGLFGKESALGKIFAGAEIANNTAMNASKAFSQAAVFASNPLTAPLAPNAYIQGGIIIATGAAQLAKLVVPQAKAARGMLISGPSHDGGGVPIMTPNGMIEAEGGEPILTKKAFRMFPQLISDINVAVGGIPLYARGGLAGISPGNLATVQNSIINNNFDFERMSSVIRDAVLEGSAIGTHHGAQSGITDLSTNRRIAEGANF